MGEGGGRSEEGRTVREPSREGARGEMAGGEDERGRWRKGARGQRHPMEISRNDHVG